MQLIKKTIHFKADKERKWGEGQAMGARKALR